MLGHMIQCCAVIILLFTVVFCAALLYLWCSQMGGWWDQTVTHIHKNCFNGLMLWGDSVQVVPVQSCCCPDCVRDDPPRSRSDHQELERIGSCIPESCRDDTEKVLVRKAVQYPSIHPSLKHLKDFFKKIPDILCACRNQKSAFPPSSLSVGLSGCHFSYELNATTKLCVSLFSRISSCR